MLSVLWGGFMKGDGDSIFQSQQITQQGQCPCPRECGDPVAVLSTSALLHLAQHPLLVIQPWLLPWVQMSLSFVPGNDTLTLSCLGGPVLLAVRMECHASSLGPLLTKRQRAGEAMESGVNWASGAPDCDAGGLV